MRCRPIPLSLVLLPMFVLAARAANAQAPIIDEPRPQRPGSGESRLGPAPGAGASPFANTPGANELLGGRPGSSTPRAPASISRPAGDSSGLPQPLGIGPTQRLRVGEVPLYGSLAIPTGGDDEGPPGGLTLDAAIERLIRENLTLRSQFLEIPQAQADVLTASLRANPILYADAQLIPYGGYSQKRSGGPTQYDINISHPLDLSGKRRARTAVACKAKKVLEAQYQDAVRLQIDNLYTAYVDVLAARETVRFARASIGGLNEVLALTQRLQRGQVGTEAEVNQVRIQRDTAAIGLAEAEENLQNAKRTLAGLLNLPPGEATALELRGSMRDTVTAPPPVEALVQSALETRPDLMAQRLGISRAESDVKLQLANRYADAYVLAQPYTYQRGTPGDLKGSHSWAVGMTIPLPLYNRNQGNIQRARLNVSQTQVELADLERRAVTEVERAERDYAVTRASVGKIEGDLLPAATQVRDNALRLYRSGDRDITVYLNAQRDLNEVVRQYRETLIRHRRAMLRLNTAVGQRLLP